MSDNAKSNNFPPSVAIDKTATISAGQTKSPAIDLRGLTICGLYIPSGFTGNSISFEAATTNGGSYVGVNKDGAAFSIDVSAGKYIILSPSDFAGIQNLKIVSNASEGTESIITLATRLV